MRKRTKAVAKVTLSSRRNFMAQKSLQDRKQKYNPQEKIFFEGCYRIKNKTNEAFSSILFSCFSCLFYILCVMYIMYTKMMTFVKLTLGYCEQSWLYRVRPIMAWFVSCTTQKLQHLITLLSRINLIHVSSMHWKCKQQQLFLFTLLVYSFGWFQCCLNSKKISTAKKVKIEDMGSMAAKKDLKDSKEILLIVPMHYEDFYYLIWNYLAVLQYWKFSINLV